MHRDLANNNVLDSFTYTLDTVGNITRVAHAEASRWDYGYAGRNRLESASRYNSQGGMVDYYYYAYDDADNMLQKLWWNGV